MRAMTSIGARIKKLVRNREWHAARGRSESAQAKRHRKLGIKQRRIVKRRTAAIQKLKSQRGGGAKAALTWALAQVGTVEHPAGSNWGPKIRDWIKASGYTGPVPWCACFATEAAHAGGAAKWKTGYCPTILAGNAALGYKRVPAALAQPGDFVLFKFPGVSNASADHIGILTSAPSGGYVNTVEGNTSSGLGGSQNNGDGVWARTRSTSLVAGYVHPPYPAR
jgi:hypothetical protein